MTAQFKILTGIGAGFNDNLIEDGLSGYVINPFYKATKQQVITNFEYAKKIWPEILINFRAAWLETQARENGCLLGGVFNIEKFEAAIRAGKITQPPPKDWKLEI